MEAWRLTFLRKIGIREALEICAVVVNHEIPSYPSHFPITCRINHSSLPRTGQCSTGVLEVSESCSEWCILPICFDWSTSCCPVVCIPKCWVQSHWLLLGESNAYGLHVLEDSNGNPINQESEKKKKLKNIRTTKYYMIMKKTQIWLASCGLTWYVLESKGLSKCGSSW